MPLLHAMLLIFCHKPDMGNLVTKCNRYHSALHHYLHFFAIIHADIHGFDSDFSDHRIEGGHMGCLEMRAKIFFTASAFAQMEDGWI
ncbi:MAG: hypothetical protein ABJP02_05330 [Parasphingorhabdus sp.]|uniref:hypothetical protein n=1 Tax=Parasphingorhabdus sp. TaxID=2709688 RepID=UPI00329A3DFA